MKVGMVCYASHGGSGIVATELGAQLAARGHEIHFITNDVPVRLDRFSENIYFHRVEVDHYPVFAYNRTSTPYDGGWEFVRTTVWYSSPDWGATGTKYFSKTYQYWLKAGTNGQWYGTSVNDHPDFAWVPTGKRPASGTNPYVTERNVEAITGLDV